VLYNPGDQVEMIHFPCGASLVSFVVTMEDGRDIDAAQIGSDGAVGGIVSRARLPGIWSHRCEVGRPIYPLADRQTRNSQAEIRYTAGFLCALY
jgi:hypothetical protein